MQLNYIFRLQVFLDLVKGIKKDCLKCFQNFFEPSLLSLTTRILKYSQKTYLLDRGLLGLTFPRLSFLSD